MKDFIDKVSFIKNNINIIEDYSRDILFMLESIIIEIKNEDDN
jgi:hypothetical protein